MQLDDRAKKHRCHELCSKALETKQRFHRFQQSEEVQRRALDPCIANHGYKLLLFPASLALAYRLACIKIVVPQLLQFSRRNAGNLVTDLITFM